MTQVCIRRIATATPPHDVHAGFLAYAARLVQDDRTRTLLRHMTQRSGIKHRYSFIQVDGTKESGSLDGHALFGAAGYPGTARRMGIFEQYAPQLLRATLDRLNLTIEERARIGHVIVTCCTGLYAPGLDFAAIDHLGLDPDTDRTMVGFMGCYAAINGLKIARHIVRSQPEQSVLMVNLELCSLHLQETHDLEQILAFVLFADGCAASLIEASDRGFALDEFRAVQIPNTRELIRWRIGDLGFDMELSSRVPQELRKALCEQNGNGSRRIDTDVDLWAVHPGGRAILDAVGAGLDLEQHALDASRAVLSDFGNMSSATVMFVLEQLISTSKRGQRGCAMSFGPGLTAETMNFHVV